MENLENIRTITIDDGDEVEIIDFLSVNDLDTLYYHQIARLCSLEIGEQMILNLGAHGTSIIKRKR